MGLPRFSEAEFWNTVLWAPIGQELFTLLKRRAVGDRSVFDRVARATVTNARRAGIDVDGAGLRSLLAQDRLLEALIERDLIELDRALESVVQASADWNSERARTVLVAVLLLAMDEELPEQRQLDFAAHRSLSRKLESLRTQLAVLDVQSQTGIELLLDFDSRVDRLTEEILREARPMGYRESYDSVIKAFEARHLPGLKDREAELAHLVRVVSEGPGYTVIQGRMYAGKTALLTALRQRLANEGCDVLMFFIRRGSDDKVAEFLPSVITQLLSILETYDARLTREGVATTFEGRLTQFADLWHQATRVSDQPLVLIVDALDEQQRRMEETTISRILPTDLGNRGRVLVSTRLNPDFAAVVPPEHPLAVIPKNRLFLLTPSPYATVQQEKVRRELDHHLAAGDPNANT